MLSSFPQLIRRSGQALSRLLRMPFVVIAMITGAALSPRALAAGFVLIAIIFAVAPWLRPPISNDLRGYHLGWEISGVAERTAAETLDSPRTWRADSISSSLLVVLAAGLVAVLFRPRYLPWVAGAVAVVATAATAAVMLNHPSLIEALDSQWEQRTLIRNVFSQRTEFLLAGNSGPRVEELEDANGPFATVGLNRQAPLRGWMYVVFGPWLVGFSLVTLGLSIRGSVYRRLQVVTVWGLAGLLLAGAVTARRWMAEYHCVRALALENNNRFDEARQQLGAAIGARPDLGTTEALWHTLGRIDYRQGLHSTYRIYFEADQLFHLGDMDQSRVLAEQVVKTVPNSPTPRVLAGKIIAQLAKQRYMQDNVSGASSTWADGATIAPWRFDCRLGTNIARAQANRYIPELIESKLAPELNQIGDRTLRSDVAALIGDAYFEDGQFTKARQFYDLASDIFSLPKYINPHAQERMLGM